VSSPCRTTIRIEVCREASTGVGSAWTIRVPGLWRPRGRWGPSTPAPASSRPPPFPTPAFTTQSQHTQAQDQVHATESLAGCPTAASTTTTAPSTTACPPGPVLRLPSTNHPRPPGRERLRARRVRVLGLATARAKPVSLTWRPTSTAFTRGPPVRRAATGTRCAPVFRKCNQSLQVHTLF